MRKLLLVVVLALAVLGGGASSALAGGYDGYCISQAVAPTVGATFTTHNSYWGCSTNSSVVDKVQQQTQFYSDSSMFYSTMVNTYPWSNGLTVYAYASCPYPGRHTWATEVVYRYHFTGTSLWSGYFYTWSDTPNPVGACA